MVGGLRMGGRMGGMLRGGAEFAYLGSILGLLALLQAIIPRQLWSAAQEFLGRCFAWVSIYTRVDVFELDGSHSNEIYEAVKLHVASLTAAHNDTSRRLVVSKVKGAASPSFRPATNEKVVDVFEGVKFWWVHRAKQQFQQRGGSSWGQQSSEEKRYFTLAFHRRYRQSLLQSYLDYVVKHANELDHQNRTRKLFSNPLGDGRRLWESVPFRHSSTFSSMAMEEELKRKIVDDLDAFKVGEGFYNRVGRAWKRGYLLYGPPGTGKSSLIAAIANYTKYDVYDLELTEVRSNADLRRLLMHVRNRSIIVIEDIDCSLELKNRARPPVREADVSVDEEIGSKADQKKKKEIEERSRVTLSGVLNFTDGLWSSIGSERILIFTTNHIDQLDPALLRSGRMDLHILLSHCGYQAFKVLASTYLEITEHELFEEIEELLRTVQITPADVAEVFIQHKNDSQAALTSLIQTLKERSG